MIPFILRMISIKVMRMIDTQAGASIIHQSQSIIFSILLIMSIMVRIIAMVGILIIPLVPFISFGCI